MSEQWVAVLAIVILAGLIDALLGEPPAALHPVVWIGKLIGFLEKRRPRQQPVYEFLWGILTVVVTCGISGGVTWGVSFGIWKLPLWAVIPLSAILLKTTFSIRGLVKAGRDVQRVVDTDTNAAREELKALVSRSRELDPPRIISATVESMAENLTDSVLAPLLAFAVFGLPGAVVYRAINTMDAMIGYRGEYEYVGKFPARLDDMVNWIPARIAGIVLCLVTLMKGGMKAAVSVLARDRHLVESPNAAWTMAPMAGALGVQLEKVGHYRLGTPIKPLTPDIIGEAAVLTWTTGVVYLFLGSGFAALMARYVW